MQCLKGFCLFNGQRWTCNDVTVNDVSFALHFNKTDYIKVLAHGLNLCQIKRCTSYNIIKRSEVCSELLQSFLYAPVCDGCIAPLESSCMQLFMEVFEQSKEQCTRAVWS